MSATRLVKEAFVATKDPRTVAPADAVPQFARRWAQDWWLMRASPATKIVPSRGRSQCSGYQPRVAVEHCARALGLELQMVVHRHLACLRKFGMVGRRSCWVPMPHNALYCLLGTFGVWSIEIPPRRSIGALSKHLPNWCPRLAMVSRHLRRQVRRRHRACTARQRESCEFKLESYESKAAPGAMQVQ